MTTSIRLQDKALFTGAHYTTDSIKKQAPIHKIVRKFSFDLSVLPHSFLYVILKFSKKIEMGCRSPPRTAGKPDAAAHEKEQGYDDTAAGPDRSAHPFECLGRRDDAGGGCPAREGEGACRHRADRPRQHGRRARSDGGRPGDGGGGGPWYRIFRPVGYRNAHPRLLCRPRASRHSGDDRASACDAGRTDGGDRTAAAGPWLRCHPRGSPGTRAGRHRRTGPFRPGDGQQGADWVGQGGV